MKKILINITNGFSLRYICHTDILSILSKKYKIILLSKNSIATKKNVQNEDIQYEEIDNEEFMKFRFSSKIYNFLEYLRYFIHGGRYNTPMNNFDAIFKSQNYIRKIFFLIIIKLFNNIKFLRKLLIKIQANTYPVYLDKLIKKISPDIVLVTSLGTFSFDEFVLRAAKKNNIRTLSVILSWDNTTTRGYSSVHTDKVIVWNNIMKKELIEFHDIEADKIYIGGVANFDDYFNKKKMTKNFFFKSNKLDRSKKLITFFTKGPSTYQFNPNITKIICDAIQQKKINNCQLITRIHPLFYKNKNGRSLFYEALNIFKDLEKKYKFLKINYPKILSFQENFDMSKNEQETLANLIYHSDIIINIYSTINIEACIFNKPLINVNFDNLKPMYKYKHGKSWRQNLHKLDRDLDHNQRIVKSGATKLADSPNELINCINEYLINPMENSKERQKLVEAEIGIFKGSASPNIANLIDKFI